ncbi:uncharacterized protein LOC141899819 isoform X2 [Tubulanus polymorphus]|uniref:uncharacterized protein LOC141899819 isoform X2 n=1 Tax=Tubulanus polymorphus TaxID=672921 RepID=UPI003DA2EA71
MAKADEIIRSCSFGLQQQTEVDTVDCGIRRVRKALSKYEDNSATLLGVDGASTVVNPVRSEIYSQQWSKLAVKKSPSKRKSAASKYNKHTMDLKESLKSRVEFLQPILCQTNIKKWRNALHRIIDLYFSDKDLHNALNFLNDTLIETISKKEKEPHEEQEVPLHENKLPILLDKKVTEWTDLWTGLHCNYTGPDSIPDIRLSIVTVPATVSVYVLRGLVAVINALNDLHINTIKHILSMTSEEAEQLLAVLKSLECGYIPVKLLEPNWDLYSDIYTNCGLQKTGHKHQKHFTYHTSPDTIRNTVDIYTIVYTFFYGSEVPTTSKITLV